MWEVWVRSLGGEDPLKKEMATHCSILAWRIPRTEKSGGPWCEGLQRVRHDLATKQQQMCVCMCVCVCVHMPYTWFMVPYNVCMSKRHYKEQKVEERNWLP